MSTQNGVICGSIAQLLSKPSFDRHFAFSAYNSAIFDHTKFSRTFSESAGKFARLIAASGLFFMVSLYGIIMTLLHLHVYAR